MHHLLSRDLPTGGILLIVFVVSNCHLESLELMVKLPNSVHDIGEVLSNAHVHGKSTNRKILFKILQNMQFLARQGIALRGHDDKESNLLQLFKLQGCDNHDMNNWLEKKGDKHLALTSKMN